MTCDACRECYAGGPFTLCPHCGARPFQELPDEWPTRPSLLKAVAELRENYEAAHRLLQRRLLDGFDEAKEHAEAIAALSPTDEELEGAHCLAEGHKHRNRYAEALCSLRFQIESLRTTNTALAGAVMNRKPEVEREWIRKPDAELELERIKSELGKTGLMHLCATHPNLPCLGCFARKLWSGRNYNGGL